MASRQREDRLATNGMTPLVPCDIHTNVDERHVETPKVALELVAHDIRRRRRTPSRMNAESHARLARGMHADERVLRDAHATSIALLHALSSTYALPLLS